jgi:methyl-accepting chemotaxis protein
MKISRKLVICAMATSTGLVVVAGIGTLSITSIQSKLQNLTSRATPMQAKTLEVQERYERILGTMFKLGVAASADEAAKLASGIDVDLKDVDRLNGELRALDPAAARDPAEFRRARTQIAEAVSRKIGQAAAYRSQTDAIKGVVQQADASIATARSGISALEVDATRAAESGQRSSDELGATIKALLSIQTRLKDVSVLIAEADAVTNRFRLSPLRERMKAQADGIQQVGGTKNGDTMVREARTVAAFLFDAFNRDAGGLVSLRADVLSGKKEAEAGYQNARKSMLESVADLLDKIGGAVDSLEGQIAKQRQVLQASSRFRADALATIALSNEISVDVKELVSGIRLLMLAATRAEVDRAHTDLKLGDKRLQANIEHLRTGLAKMAKEALSRNAAAAAGALTSVAGAIERVAQSRLAVIESETAVGVVIQKLKTVAAEQSEAGEKQIKGITQRQAETVAAVNGEVERALFMLLAVSLVVIAASVALSIGTMRSIARPLREAVDVANAVAAGDLTSRIEVTSQDEIGQLLQALKTMNENLVNLIGDVRSNADTIAAASQQIAAGNTDLSRRTEKQASSLEETAGSMEELTSTVKQNAKNAKHANQLAVGASEVAVKGGTVVGQVVGTMASINDSSKKIADIISVIDAIAFQTRILALNAAVEAARAGEQGRGFAVVAAEVRNLAQRSAAAAKEIKELISDSVEKVGHGTKLVDEAGRTMEEIVSSVKRVTDIMSEITAASQEQSTEIEQVNQAITQMDQATQQNAALVEEAAAAAESMQKQAQSLAQAVTVFKLADETAVAAPVKVEKPVARVLRLPGRSKAAGRKLAPAGAQKVAGRDIRLPGRESF